MPAKIINISEFNEYFGQNFKHIDFFYSIRHLFDMSRMQYSPRNAFSEQFLSQELGFLLSLHPYQQVPFG